MDKKTIRDWIYQPEADIKSEFDRVHARIAAIEKLLKQISDHSMFSHLKQDAR